MKKILFFFLCLLCIESKATMWTVLVEDFQFSPSALNVGIGDMIHFAWVNGGHTSTSSTVPVGAATWDVAMNVLHPTFDYTVTVAGSYNFFCKIHGALVMSGSFSATGVTPVTLSAFNISSQNDKPFLLWTTLTENNADHFSLRRSYNGKDFTEIAKILCAGNSSVEKSYSFADEKIPASIKYVYYTLATIDKDGKTQLSPIKIYKNKTALAKLITSISPNPIRGMGHLMLQFNAEKPGSMKVKIVDLQGHIILQTDVAAVEGINNGHIHLGEIQGGIYIIYFSLDGINESYKITKE